MTVKEFKEILSQYADSREVSMLNIVGDVCEPQIQLNPLNGRIQIYGGKEYDN